MTSIEDDLARAYATYGETLDLIPAIERILASHGRDGARAAFERAGARDFLGLESDAIPLYRAALEEGLGEPERLQCLVQLGSSLRNVGETEAAVQILRAAGEEAQAEEQEWVAAFLALALHADGQPSEALSVALTALAPHLTQYRRAVASYADQLE